ncbi:MAG: EamA family transporter [Thermodesulfobacteriota bacterium]|nr:EamA family transporter [Thermodesulfobacteriota bacterium]MEE2975222.1 EamA family transporter [Thermodesulfobacteriota bacterium]|tara:strand:+ start:28654 stop:29094 length:441 start_codon:yes stop_codon:yes gene_type:complete
MNLNPNLLALLVAAIWGLAPIFEKLSLQSMSPLFVLFVRFVLVTSLFVPIFITSNEAFSVDQLSFRNLMLILIPGILAVVGIYLYFNALAGSSASKIVPLTAIYPLFTCFYAFIFLKEDFTTEKIVGTILIVAGVFILNYKDYLQN